MSFRTVVVKNRSKLDLQLNYLVYRGETEQRIFLPEISVLIIESTAVSLTSALLCELIKNGTKVIFCDEKHLPCSQLIGLNENYHSSKNLKEQIAWTEENKAKVWQNIIYHKINNQSKLLQKRGYEQYSLLETYKREIEYFDRTNREGHSAKVYFHALFEGEGRRVVTHYNKALNYGYAVLLSEFCRVITASGYITQLGIWHKNEFNFCNLGCDFMETYRTIVDDAVLSLRENDNYKSVMANILNTKIKIDGKNMYLDCAVELYLYSLFRALRTGETAEIMNYSDYELPIYENNGVF